MKRSAGRPSKYQAKFCEMLVQHMSKGADLRSFGAIVRVTEETLHNWKKEHQEFKEAYELGSSLSYGWWEEKSRQLTNGKINTALFIVNMRNRFNWAGKDPVDDKKEDKQTTAYSDVYRTWEKRISER